MRPRVSYRCLAGYRHSPQRPTRCLCTSQGSSTLAWPSGIAFVAASGSSQALLDPSVNRLSPVLLRPHPGTRAPSLHRSYPASSVLRAPPSPTRASTPKALLTCRRSLEWASRVSRPSLLACCRPPPRRSESVVSSRLPIRASLPPVQAGSAFASCISGPPRRSLTLRPTNSQTAFRRLFLPGFAAWLPPRSLG